MPATFEKDKNGRWVLTGSPGVERAIEVEQAVAPAKPKAKPKPKGFLERLSNDISYEAKQAMTHPARSISRAIGNALPVALSPMVGPAMSNRTLQEGTIGAASNAARVLLEATQKVRGKKADYTKTGGSAIDSQEDVLQRLLGNKAPSEMTTGELAAYGLKNSTALNLAIGGGGTIVQGLKFVGPVATRLGAFLDAGNATTKVGAVARLAAGAAAEEAISTPLDDNRGGSAISLINALVGRELMKDPVQPGMSISDAGLAAWAPNAALGGAIGIGALGVSSIAKARRGARAAAEVKAANSALEEHGVIQSNPETGQTAFTGQAVSGKQADAKLNEMFGLEPKQAPAVETAPGTLVAPAAPAAPVAPVAPAPPTAVPSLPMEPGGAVQGSFPSTTREVVDPWAQEYDPALPEATTALQVYNQLDDNELTMVAAQPSPLEAANQLVSTRVHAEVNPQIRTSLTAAPAENVANPVGTWRDQWQSANTGTLRDLAHPNNSPELFEKVQNLTGRDWQEFTKADIVDGLDLLHQDGITVLPNRLTGGQVLPIEEIKVDPLRFQYKQGVDEQGQQLGNSLTGIEKWNPDMEGTVQVWEDPADGNTYVVNGHNRLAAAQRMDVPSLRVDYITAARPEEARMRGALTNIAEGSGTPFDAAKALKGMGITDEGQMKAIGLPLKSGLGKQGLALSKLPDNIFQGTVDGKISMNKAVALGQAGLDEAGMQEAYKALQGKDMSDDTWREVLQQAGSAPVVQGAQTDLFGNTESMNLMVQKGQLAAAVKAELVGDKNLMKKVGRSADQLNEVGSTQIDAAATQQMGMDAQMLIGEFDVGKYAEGHPFSQLLNQGAEEIAAGGKTKIIARRIKRQIAELGEQMPATAVEKAPVEEMALPPPKRLTEADRIAARVELVKDAIAKGEVRPPTTPMPELFEDSGVNIAKVQRELEAGIISDDAIKMLDDELRLQKAFAERDAEAALIHTAEVRDAAEYELLTFDEKQAHGTMPDLFSDDVMAAGPLNTSTPPLNAVQEAAPTAGFELPKGLAGAKPRYGYRDLNFEVSFGNDFDRAAYTLAGDAKGTSNQAAKYRQAFEDAGYDLKEVTAHGQKVKAALKEQARAWRPDPKNQSIQALELPAQEFHGLRSFDVVKAAAVEQKLAIDNQMNQIRNQASKEGC